ncbi:MAG TPA: hypothetical protein VGS01_02625 [Candidatus Limnocylindria bacterium]|jgi:hypothetical protein|nr:hypothetical protein [Candidatus Limnocylindria bacterium]
MPLEYVDDLGPAKWIAERLHPFAQDAGAIIPPGFEAYARIFHPATRQVGSVELPITWREIADANLRVHHPEMQFGALVTLVGTSGVARQPQPGLFDRWPKTGSLPLDLARVLVGLLGRHTTTPDLCWFAAWEGWGTPVFATSVGSTETPAMPAGMVIERPKVPTFKVPGRGYYIARGPLTSALDTVYGVVSHYQSASIWWPDDRAWCVATEVDFDWTYVGGSARCIADVVANDKLEALPARLNDGVRWDSDGINPTPR